MSQVRCSPMQQAVESTIAAPALIIQGAHVYGRDLQSLADLPSNDFQSIKVKLPGCDDWTHFELIPNRNLLSPTYADIYSTDEMQDSSNWNNDEKRRSLADSVYHAINIEKKGKLYRGRRLAAFSIFKHNVRGLVLDGTDHHYIDYHFGDARAKVRSLTMLDNNSSLPSDGAYILDNSLFPDIPKTLDASSSKKSSRSSSTISQTEQVVESSVSTSTNTSTQDPRETEVLYVEVLAVNDFKRLQLLTADSANATEETVAIFNMVDLIYSTQNWGVDVDVRIVLAGQIHFNSSDPYVPSSVSASEISSLSLLQKINSWRVNSLDEIPKHDVLHLMSGYDFDNSTVGLAYLSSVCDDTTACDEIPNGYCYTNTAYGCCVRNAASISQIEWTIVPSAEIIAHEIGHQLSFSHDSQAQGSSCLGAIMSPYVDTSNRTDVGSFSSCSVNTFQSVLASTASSAGYYPYGCLANVPSSEVKSTTPDISAASMRVSPLKIVLLILSWFVLSIVTR